MLTGLSPIEIALYCKPRGPAALDAYYIDSVAGNDANPGTELSPWASPLPLVGRSGGVPGAPKEVYFKKGSTFPVGIRVDTNYWSFLRYGPGSDPVICNQLADLKGVAGDWTDETLNRWSRSGFASTGGVSGHGKDQVVFDGVGGRWRSSTGAMTQAGDWRRVDSTGKIWVYSTSNPATAFTTLQHVPDVADGAATGQAIETPNQAIEIYLDGEVVGVDSGGFEFYGFTRLVYMEGGSHDCEIKNFKFQYGYQGIILDNANNNGLTISNVIFGPGKIFDTGLYDGSSAIYHRQGNIASVYYNDIHVDSRNAEDCFQMGGNNSSVEMRTAYVNGCRFERSAENPIDLKVGDVTFVDTFAVADANQQACVTSQGHARMFKARNSCFSGLGSVPASQVQGGYKNYADMERCMIYSNETSVFFQVNSGVACRFAFCVALTTYSADSELLRWTSAGNPTLIHCTTVAFSTTGSCAAQIGDTPVVGGVTSITKVSGPSGGFYTYAYTKAAGIGLDRFFRIAGLTGLSAELNSLAGEMYQQLDVISATDTTGTFLVPASHFAGTPIPSADVSGITITYITALQRLANNLLSSYGSTHSALGTPLIIENTAALQAGWVNEPNFTTGSGAVVKYPTATSYTAAQVISAVAAAGNLFFDSGGKLGGATWKSGTTQASTPAAVTSITLDGYYATVVTTGAHTLAAGQMFALDGITNYDGCNGCHFVLDSADNTHFRFQLPRVLWGLVAQLATGTIVLSEGVADVDVSGASVLTLASMGLFEGKDFKGHTLSDADPTRKFGAVQ